MSTTTHGTRERILAGVRTLADPRRGTATRPVALVRSGGVPLVLVVALATAPLWLSPGDEYTAGLAVIAILFALSYNLLLGTTGMVSFGHAAFYGLGAFTVALITTRSHGNALEGLVLSPIVGLISGLVIGALCLRAVRLYFALLTLAVGQLLYVVAFEASSLTGGDNGIHGIPVPDFLNDPTTSYYFVLAIVVAAAALLFVLTRSPFGTALNGIRDNRQRAAFVGISVKRYELAAFAIAGCLASLAGALYAMYDQQAYAGLMYWTQSGIPVVMVLIGGMRAFLGPVYGAIFYTFLAAKVQNTTIYWDLIIGAILLVVVLALPRGLAGLPARFADLAAMVNRRRRATAPTRRVPAGAEALVAAADAGDSRPPARQPAPARRHVRDGASLGVDAPLLEVSGLVKRFGGLAAVDGVDLRVPRSGVHAVIGPNGAGKSTLFNLVSGQLRPDAGRVVFDGADVTGALPQRLARLGMGRSFQTTAVFPEMSALENVSLAMAGISGETRRPIGAIRRETRGASEAILDVVGLAAHARSRAGDLSHGDQRALELAISLAVDARLLVLDEPTAGMSPYETRRTLEMLRRVSSEQGVTLLFTEHDMEVVFGIAEHVTVMAEGRVIAEGSPEAVRAHPEVVRVYLGDESLLAVGAGA